MHGIGAIRPNIKGVAEVICGPGNPVPHQSCSSIVVVGFAKDGVEQGVTAGQVASLNTQVPYDQRTSTPWLGRYVLQVMLL